MFFHVLPVSRGPKTVKNRQKMAYVKLPYTPQKPPKNDLFALFAKTELFENLQKLKNRKFTPKNTTFSTFSLPRPYQFFTKTPKNSHF